MRALALLLLLAGTARAYGGKTAEQYRDSCIQGGTKDCNTLAYMNEEGVEVPQDHARARDLYQISCNRGSAVACDYLGIVYETGRAAPVDAPRAAKLYRKACDGGVLSSCVNLGLMTSEGRGVPRSAKKAAALYEKVCAKDPAAVAPDDRKVIAGACQNLGNLQDPGGDGVAQDLKSAGRLYKRSCELGNEDACGALRYLQAHGAFKGPTETRTTHLGAADTR